jgi:hypothetical protein
MNESVRETDKRERLAEAGRSIESAILTEAEPTPFFTETERLELRQMLTENGVNFKPFQNGKAVHLESGEILEMKDGTHASKFAMVTACLSREKFKVLALKSLEEALKQPGGAVVKADAEIKSSDQEILDFANGYLEKQFGRKTRPKFAPRKQGAKHGIDMDEDTATNTIYRLEAITASAYVLLRTFSYDVDSAEKAIKFQTGDVANKQLRERVIRGKTRSYPTESNGYKEWKTRQTDEKNIRHLPIGTLPIVTKQLWGWE